MTRILVTGSAGFIGAAVVGKLVSLGHEVVGIDNINDYYDVNLKYARLANVGINRNHVRYGELVKSETHANYRFCKLDLKDKDGINSCFSMTQCEVVCNLAAQAGVRHSINNPEEYIENNIVGFLNILEACRRHKIRHMVYASSSSVYGNNDKQPFSVTDNVDYPISLYAATKKSNELMAHSYTHLFGLPTTGLRFFTVYGPWGRPDMSPMLFASAISGNQPIQVFNNGDLERDFTYIDDIVNGVSSVILNSNITSNKHYKIYNIGAGKPIKLLTFIKEIEGAFNKLAIREYVPMQAGDVYSTYADISGMHEDFNYTAHTNIHDGILKFAEWYNGFYK